MDFLQALSAGLGGYMRGRQMRQQQDLRKQMYELKNKPDALDAARLSLVEAQTNALTNKPDEFAKLRFNQLENSLKTTLGNDQQIRARLATMPLSTAYKTAYSERNNILPKLKYFADQYDQLPEGLRLPGLKGEDWVKSLIPAWQYSELLGTAEPNVANYLATGLPFKDMTPDLRNEYNKLVIEMSEGTFNPAQMDTMWSGFHNRALGMGLSESDIQREFPYAAPGVPITRNVPVPTADYSRETGTFSPDFGIFGQRQVVTNPDGTQRIVTRNLPAGLVDPEKQSMFGGMEPLASRYAKSDITTRHLMNMLNIAANPMGYTGRRVGMFRTPEFNPPDYDLNTRFMGENERQNPAVSAELNKIATQRGAQAVKEADLIFKDLFNVDVMSQLGIRSPTEYATPEGFTRAVQYVLKANPEIEPNFAIQALGERLQQGELVSAPVEMRPQQFVERPVVQPTEETKARLAQVKAQTARTNVDTEIAQVKLRVDKETERATIQGRLQKPDLDRARFELEQDKFNDMTSWRQYLRTYMDGMLGVNRERASLARDEFNSVKLPQLYANFADIQFQAANQHAMTMNTLSANILQQSTFNVSVNDPNAPGGRRQVPASGRISTLLSTLSQPLSAQDRSAAERELADISEDHPTLVKDVKAFIDNSRMFNLRYQDATRAGMAAQSLHARNMGMPPQAYSSYGNPASLSPFGYSKSGSAGVPAPVSPLTGIAATSSIFRRPVLPPGAGTTSGTLTPPTRGGLVPPNSIFRIPIGPPSGAPPPGEISL